MNFKGLGILLYGSSKGTHLVSGGPFTACACDGTSVINGTALLGEKCTVLEDLFLSLGTKI